MANSWLRLWHELPNDPKWRTIARISGRSIAEVVTVYLHILVDASTATERGRTQPNAEDIASALDVSSESITAILSAMEGRVVEEGFVLGWDKRQPQREDNSADRAKRWREERKQTQPNATERNRTLDKDKEEIKNTSSRDKREADPRHKVFKEVLDKAWHAKNKTEMPWSASEGKQLAEVLSANPSMTADAFTALLRNRHKSEVNHAERPRAWLARITDYANGPIDRYGKPMSETKPALVPAPVNALEEIRERNRKAMEEVAKHAG